MLQIFPSSILSTKYCKEKQNGIKTNICQKSLVLHLSDNLLLKLKYRPPTCCNSNRKGPWKCMVVGYKLEKYACCSNLWTKQLIYFKWSSEFTKKFKSLDNERNNEIIRLKLYLPAKHKFTLKLQYYFIFLFPISWIILTVIFYLESSQIVGYLFHTLLFIIFHHKYKKFPWYRLLRYHMHKLPISFLVSFVILMLWLQLSSLSVHDHSSILPLNSISIYIFFSTVIRKRWRTAKAQIEM